MIQSLTGFGKATCEYGNKKIVVEVNRSTANNLTFQQEYRDSIVKKI